MREKELEKRKQTSLEIEKGVADRVERLSSISRVLFSTNVAALEKLKEFAAELGFPLRRDGNNPRSLRLPNGSRIVARSAVARSVRGFSKASLIIIDDQGNLITKEGRSEMSSSDGAKALSKWISAAGKAD